jgi:membrane protein
MAMRQRIEAFQKSAPGRFVKKVLDDRAPNLAIILAWGTLNTMLPLLLGILSVAGFLLRDPQRVQTITDQLISVLPQSAAETLQGIITPLAENAGKAGIISALLLLFTGSNFFANMQSVFDLAYHVPDRNFVVQRVIALVMLVIVTVLVIIATTASGLAGLVSSIGIAAPGGPVVAVVIGWLVALLSLFVLFALLYWILPNVKQGWRNVLLGALLATVLTLLISQVFPLYLKFFGGGFAVYQAFGTFLVLTFWLYLLGLVMVLGAELNAFLEAPERSTALAEAQMQAQTGKATQEPTSEGVAAVAVGRSSPGIDGSPPDGDAGEGAAHDGTPVGAAPKGGSSKGHVSLAGRLIGLAGLLLAARMVGSGSGKGA